MEQLFEPLVFTRHRLKLHALIIQRQPWFCLRDLGRLMGLFFEDRVTNKLSPDQRRHLTLRYYDETKEMQMVSESGAYALLLYHHHPENQQLRQWLTYHVVPLLNDACMPTLNNMPTPGLLEWQGAEMSVLHWQSEPWIRLRDMPHLLPGRNECAPRGGWKARIKHLVGR